VAKGEIWQTVSYRPGLGACGRQHSRTAPQSRADLGNRMGESSALSELGAVRRLTGDYRGASQALQTALGICRDLGDRLGQAEALNEVGTLHRVCGDLDQAGVCHRQALDLARAIDSSWDEASALAGWDAAPWPPTALPTR